MGAHSTGNPDVFDGYLGSGKILLLAIKKHGKENFIRETLSVFETAEEMFAEERRIVNSEFLKRDDIYNLVVGGTGPSEKTKKKMSESRKGEKNHMFGKHHSDESKKKISLLKKINLVICLEKITQKKSKRK